MTESGLNTVNLSDMTTWQQVLLWLLILFGGSIWVSIWTVHARKHAFEERFKNIVLQRRERRRMERSMSMAATHEKRLAMLRTFRGFGKARTKDTAVDRAVKSDLRPNAGSSHDGDRITNLRISPPMDARKFANTVSDRTGTEHEMPDGIPQSPSGDHIRFSDQPNTSAASTARDMQDTERGLVNRGFRARGDGKEQAGVLQDRDILTRDRVGRNAQFYGLSSEERDHLGGREYQALKLLGWVVPLYWLLYQAIGCIALGAWQGTVIPEPSRANAINPWWNGVFNAVSAFNNSGMSVLDANMIPFDNDYFVLIVMGFLILAGNTAYPIFLRLIFRTMLTCMKLCTPEGQHQDFKATLEYILKYPRRVYTNLFPSMATWWLLFMLFVLNGTDWVGYEVLNLGNPALEGTPVNSRIIDGLFQALAVRSGGFYVVAISNLYIGLQVLYVIMMYISVYPVVITMRHSNVYEERSLGIYADEPPSGVSTPEEASSSRARHSRHRGKESTFSQVFRRTFTEWHGVGAASPQGRDRGESRINFIGQQIRGQLAHDLWWLVLAVFLISTIETQHFLEDPATYSVFNILFEVVSAYGTVGISVGLPNQAFSFSGGWFTGSKLVLCAVMIRGRHRGLPVALDRAVRLPGDEMHVEEEEDHNIRRSMSRRPPSFEV